MSFDKAITIEVIALAVFVVTSALVILSGPPQQRGPARALATVVVAWGVLALVTGSFLAATDEAEGEVLEAALPVRPETGREPDGFATSGACRACHPGEYDSWRRTYHRTMTQLVTPETVQGDFDDVQLSFDGRDVRLFRDGDAFMIEGPDPDWEMSVVAQGGDPDELEAPFRSTKRVVMATGSHHMQAYWVPSRDNHRLLINFPYVWLNDAQRWVPREAAFLRPPDARRLFQVWNDNCIHCHAVEGEPRIDYATGHLETRVAELGISCEACHGPSAEHAEGHRDPLARYARHRAQAPDDSVIQPERLDARESTEVCGQCHSITMPLVETQRTGARFHAGDRLTDTRTVIRATDRYLAEGAERDTWAAGRDFILGRNPRFYEERFWDDGMPRLSGREYNSLIESPCYQDGTLSCLTCHSMHAYESPVDLLRPGMRGDAACLDCHGEYAADIPAHTFHPAGSSGSACMNCHMAYTTSGLVKVIRSHQVDSPNVATDLAHGRPNACSLCHLDRPLGWAAEALASWYGQPIPELSADDRTVAAGVRWLLEGDAGLRSVAAGNSEWAAAREASGTEWLVPYLGQLLDDPYAVVRAIAERSLRTIPGYADLDYDYVGPPDQRAAVARAVLDAWRVSPGALDAAVLVRDDGTLDREAFERHLRRRNDRPMDLQE